MKLSLIKHCLANYDQGKGIFRSLGDETHMSNLRKLYKELGGDKATDRELTAEELLNLVKILLEKKTWNESQSAKIFAEIFKQLGGKEAYDYFVEKRCLTKENVAFLEQNASVHQRNNQEILGLAILVDYSAQCVPPLPLTTLLQESACLNLVSMKDKSTCMSNLKKEGLLSKEALLLVVKGNEAEIAEKLIRLLHAQRLFNDSNLALLSKSPDALDAIFSIMTSLGKKVFPPEFCDVTKLFALDAVTLTNLMLYIGFIEQQVEKKNITVSRETGETLLAHQETLAKQNSNMTRSLLTTFDEGRWDVSVFLHYFFAIKSDDLHYIISRMAKLSLDAQYLVLVLDATTTSPGHRQAIVQGIFHLKEANALSEENLRFILSSCPHAHSLAVALTQWPYLKLKLKQIPMGQSELLKYPRFAEKVVSALLELSKARELTEDDCRLVTANPDSAEVAKNIFQRLARGGFANQEMLKFLYANHLINPAFCQALIALDEASILTKSNVIKLSLVQNARYMKTLASACTILNNAKATVLNAKGSCTKLNQGNFDALLKTPMDALSVAESLGGKLVRLGAPEEQGAAEYVRIRNAARGIAEEQSNGSLFGPYIPPIKSGKRHPRALEPLTPEQRQELEKKSVLHIARFLGNGLLEKDVEEKVAKDTVEEVFKLRH